MPCLEVLGVYRPQISAETWREHWQITGNDELIRAHFEKLVLIEAEVEGLTEPLKMAKRSSARCSRMDRATKAKVDALWAELGL